MTSEKEHQGTYLCFTDDYIYKRISGHATQRKSKSAWLEEQGIKGGEVRTHTAYRQKPKYRGLITFVCSVFNVTGLRGYRERIAAYL
ncbi:hypothetical protein LCGC14_1874760 [marine sediment metagenome]|uniref:Uncharacterized protein n=1 Tax=marine sediment metagenome TaxID=412755 RepID=A0A0F9G458_9ZZZZ